MVYVGLAGASVYYGPNSNIISRETLVTPFRGGHHGTHTLAALTRSDLPPNQPCCRFIPLYPSWLQQFDRCLILLESFELRPCTDDTRTCPHLSVTNAPQLYIVRGDASTEHSQPTKGKNIWSKGGDLFDRAASKLWGWIFCRHASPRLSRYRFKPVVFLPLDSRFVVFVARWSPIRGFRCSLAPDPSNRRLTRELCYAMERNSCATFH